MIYYFIEFGKRLTYYNTRAMTGEMKKIEEMFNQNSDFIFFFYCQKMARAIHVL